MTTAQLLQDMTTEKIATDFEEVCIAQDKWLAHGQTSKFNKAYDLVETMMAELKSREPDQRAVLTRLYRHPNRQVRFSAAIYTLALFPDQARAVLQILSDRDEYPQAANARMIMDGLDDGSFVPT